MIHDIPKSIILETQRLWLKEINPDILNSLFSSANDEEIIEFLGLSSFDELETERAKYTEGLTGFKRSFKYFQLIDKLNDKIIGRCGYHNWMLIHYRAEMGYNLLEGKFKRQGFMTEVIKPILAFGFEQMNLNRVEALISPQNEPSLKLVKGLGFMEEGTLRQHYYTDNKYEDSIIFSILKDEYIKRNI